MASRGVALKTLSLTDEARYRNEVLQLKNGETEETLEEQLVAEASELGLKIPDIQIAASLAATINAGYLDFTTPSPSAAGSTRTRQSLSHPRAFADLVRSSITSADQLTSSLSETTLSDRGHSGSIPSIDSLSTRPTSISSCDVRIISPQSGPTERVPLVQSQQQMYSPGSPASSTTSASALRLSERKRSSFINAIGRPFRKRRTPSAVNLPPNAHISLKKNEGGGASTVLVETIPVRANEAETESSEEAQSQATIQVEVPVFDEAALHRSMEDTHLKEIFQKHKAQRSRFVRLQNEILDSLKAAHLAVLAEKKARNQAVEKEKQEQNAGHISRMEERQLSIEIDQIKEFEKMKRNSQTRIKYMEGYVSTSSPPSSPRLSDSDSGFFDPLHTGSDSGADSTSTQQQQQQQQRTVTRRQKERLAQEYLDRDSMDRLHEARIKVLRERQEKQLQDTTARLAKELELLINRNSEALTELERDHQREEQEILQIFCVKKNRLRRQWNIEEAILRKKLEMQHGVPYGPLPIVSFSIPDDDSEHATVAGDDQHRHHHHHHHHHYHCDGLDNEIPVLKNPFAKKDP